MKTKIRKSDQFMGTGTGAVSEALNLAMQATGKPLLAVAKSEIVHACGAGLVAYAPRDWSPTRKQWLPSAIYRGERGVGRGVDVQEQEMPAAARVVNAERRAFEVARDAAQRAAVAVELDRLRALRVVALASGAGEVVAMAPLGEGKGSKSRAIIERGGETGEDEARQCAAMLRQRIDFDGAALAFAAGQLGERFAHAWYNRKSAAMLRDSGQILDERHRADVVSIFRAAGVAAVMGGAVNGLLGCRSAIRSARRDASREIYVGGGRDGRDTSDGLAAVADWEARQEWRAQGAMPCGPSSSPDKSAGAGLRPSIVGELASWGDSVRAACQAKIAAASTPAAKGNATAAAARRIDLIRGLFDYCQGGEGLDPELLAEFFEGGEVNGPLSEKGHKRIQRMRKVLS